MIVDNQTLLPEQAFLAMLVFLRQYYARGGCKDDLAALLSDIQSITEDGLPADPAAREDWLDAVRTVLEEIPR
jgi:hypothetical protein